MSNPPHVKEPSRHAATGANGPTSKPGHLRSFGRRRGRPLSPRQSELMAKWLPRVSVDLASPAPQDLTNLFEPPVRKVAIEIGFGGGEHLVWQARQDPTVGFIGCEPFEDGVAKVVTAMETHGLTNIRLHMDDARDLLSWAPDAAFAAAYVLFPDPWPKARHVKRRLISAAFLTSLARTMATGARLRVATDIPDYLRTALVAFRACSEQFEWSASSPADWRDRPDDWPQTRYEQKAIREGRRCYYLSFKRRAISEPGSVPAGHVE